MKSRHLASQFYHFKIDFPSPPNISIEYIRATFSPIPKRRRKLELDRIEGISQFCVDWFFRGNTLLFIQDNNTRVKFIKTFHIRKDRFASEYNFWSRFFQSTIRSKKERKKIGINFNSSKRFNRCWPKLKQQSRSRRSRAGLVVSKRVDQFPKSEFQPRRSWPPLRGVNRSAFSLPVDFDWPRNPISPGYHHPL